MSLWRQLTAGLRVLVNWRKADEELDEAIRHYIHEAEAAGLARGLPAAQARRTARLESGDVAAVRDRVRSSTWEHVVGTSLADVRYAGRRLWHSPGFTAVSVITLAVGIGATTAIISAFKAVLLEPLPYPQSDRIVMIADTGNDREPLDVTFGTYRELAQRSRSFEALAPVKQWQPTVVGATEPERLSGQRVGAEFFRALGVVPAIGRDFQPDEDRPKGANVTILSHALWIRRFDADPSIVGKFITLDDALYQVVGVMPRMFEDVLAPTTELWAPLQYSTVFGPDDREWGHHLRLLARLRARVGVEAARQELNHIALRPEPDFSRVPWAGLQNGLIATSLEADVSRGIRPALFAILGAVVLLLAIACVNVTNLLLARGAQRRGEFAMRVALGAGRGRLFRQVLTESVLLSLVGGALAMIAAAFALGIVVALAPPELPRVGAIRLDGTVFAFALCVTTIVGAIVGLIPAMQAARPDVRTGTEEMSRRTEGGHQRAR